MVAHGVGRRMGSRSAEGDAKRSRGSPPGCGDRCEWGTGQSNLVGKPKQNGGGRARVAERTPIRRDAGEMRCWRRAALFTHR
jgi:hypothetical protein